jgi:hypothetical protein
VSRVWVDLVVRSAGHQTSLFSIRQPEVLRRSSLEDSVQNQARSRRAPAAARLSVRQRGRARGAFGSACAIAGALAVELGTSRPIEIHVFDPVRLSMIRYEIRCAESIDSQREDGNE